MKHVKMFGKSVPLIAIVLVGLLTIGAGAKLVDFLSNRVTAKVTVESPMEVGISLGRVGWATAQCYRPAGPPNPADWTGSGNFPGGMVDAFPEGIDGPGGSEIQDWDENDWNKPISINIVGGETVTIYLMSANLANAEIKGYEELIVTNKGITCDDFVSIKSRYDSIYGDLGYGEEHIWTPSDNGCSEDTNTIQFGSTESTWGAGETDVAKIVVTFEEAASGTYTFSYRIVPE